MAFPSGSCCPLYLLRDKVSGIKKGFVRPQKDAAPITNAVLGIFECSVFRSRITKQCKNKKPCFVGNRVFQKKGDDILSHIIAVPSAQAGLTSLFGMGRGEPRRNNHLKVFGCLLLVLGCWCFHQLPTVNYQPLLRRANILTY